MLSIFYLILCSLSIVFFGEISWSCCAGWVGTSHCTVERWVGTSSVLDLGTGLGARAVWALTRERTRVSTARAAERVGPQAAAGFSIILASESERRRACIWKAQEHVILFKAGSPSHCRWSKVFKISHEFHWSRSGLWSSTLVRMKDPFKCEGVWWLVEAKIGVMFILLLKSNQSPNFWESIPHQGKLWNWQAYIRPSNLMETYFHISTFGLMSIFF